MRRILAASFLAFVACGPALAQFATPPGTSIKTQDGQTITVPITSNQVTTPGATIETKDASGNPIKLAIPNPAAIGGPIGSPTYVIQQPSGGSIIDVGQAFGAAAPWINSIVGALLTAATSWIFYLLHKYLGVNIDQKQRDSFQAALLNQASSLIADGAVKMEGAKVTINNAAMALAVTDATKAAQDAVNYFNLTPETIAAKILDHIPQVPAGSTMIAAGVASTLPPPEQAKPV
jgi:hypothetical protein